MYLHHWKFVHFFSCNYIAGVLEFGARKIIFLNSTLKISIFLWTCSTVKLVYRYSPTCFVSSGSRGGGAPGCLGPPIIFRLNWGPKGENIFFGDCHPHPTPPLLISRSGSNTVCLFSIHFSMLLTNFILNNFQYFAVPQQGASQLNF